jgi:DNA-binding response OmpR family regulator
MSEKKILLIDDDKDILQVLNLRLRSQGYQVAAASDAISAVSVARKEKPDLIVLDIGLPGGDGFIVMQRLKSLLDFALTPIIVVSARDEAATKDRALKAGAVAYFQKPINSKHFLDTVQRALGQIAVPQGG